jgi:hypothetical protein
VRTVAKCRFLPCENRKMGNGEQGKVVRIVVEEVAEDEAAETV